MKQEAPEPKILYGLVERLEYRPEWTFQLEDLDRGQGSKGLTLAIYIRTKDTDNLDLEIGVVHYFPVPPAAYNEQSWRRWLFDQILLVEQHEAAEYFKIDGERPYGPNHGPGYDPYAIREFTSPEERQINFRGDIGQNR